MSVFNASRLLGKTVLITGASAGIGAVSKEQLSGQAVGVHNLHFPGNCASVRQGKLGAADVGS